MPNARAGGVRLHGLRERMFGAIAQCFAIALGARDPPVRIAALADISLRPAEGDQLRCNISQFPSVFYKMVVLRPELSSEAVCGRGRFLPSCGGSPSEAPATE